MAASTSARCLAPGAQAPGRRRPAADPARQDPQRDLKDFSTYVFDDAQETWDGTLRVGRRALRAAPSSCSTRGAVSTGGCGGATSAVGPFYCPADQRVYLDLTFYEDMRAPARRLGRLRLGLRDRPRDGPPRPERARHQRRGAPRLERENPDDANELSVRLELQADCYAGVWASTVFAEGDLERGDLDEAFTASEAVGDDRLQSQAGGGVDPDSFTHGTSEQRRRWFTKGYESADPGACDTFSAEQL